MQSYDCPGGEVALVDKGWQLPDHNEKPQITRYVHSLWGVLYFEVKLKYLMIDGWGVSYEIALMWTSLDIFYANAALVQVMAGCHQAPGTKPWPESMLTHSCVTIWHQ